MSGPMGAVGIGATLASGFLSAAGDIFQGKAEQARYNYMSGIALQRAQVAGINAGNAYTSGETAALSSGLRTGQVLGAQRAGTGAANVAGPSAERVRASQTYAGQLDEANIRTDAARRRYGFQVEQAADVSQASAYTAAGETSKTAAGISAASSILGSIGGVASKWTQASLAGVPGFGSTIPASGLGGGDTVSDRYTY